MNQVLELSLLKYVNGTQETSFANRTNPDEDANCKFNNSNAIDIGLGSAAGYFDGFGVEASGAAVD